MNPTNGVVFTALKSLVNNRCFPNTFKQPDGSLPLWPSIRYKTVSTQPGPSICGTDQGETDDYRVQIDFVALSYGAASALRDAGVAAMENVDPPVARDGMFEDYDAETKTHIVTVDFVFYPSSQ